MLCAMEHLIDYHNNAVQFSDILLDTCPHINTQYSRMDDRMDGSIVNWKYINDGIRMTDDNGGYEVGCGVNQ